MVDSRSGNPALLLAVWMFPALRALICSIFYASSFVISFEKPEIGMLEMTGT
jgi:hypothetical protein